MEQSLFGLRGIVTDSITGNPLKVRVEISGHDIDSSHVYSNLPVGNYHRYLFQGNYNLTFSKLGYHSKTINVSILNNSTHIKNIELVPVNLVSINNISSSNESNLIIDLIGRKNKKGNLIFKYIDNKIQKFITLKK